MNDLLWKGLLLQAICLASFAYPDEPLSKELRESAESNLIDFLLDMESIGDHGYLIVGEVATDTGDGKFDGVFPFINFRAIDFSGKRKSRTWRIRSQVVDPRFMATGVAYDEVLIADDRWFTQMGGQVRKHKPDPKKPFKYIGPIIDPRISVAVMAGGVMGSSSLKRSTYQFLKASKICRVAKDPEGLLVTFDAGAKTWAHVLFNKRQHGRPSIVAFGPEGVKYDQGRNARAINHMRWEKSGELWLPVAGLNSHYFDGTRENHSKTVSIDYRIAWVNDKDLDKQLFDKEQLSSVPGVLMSKHELHIKRANAIKKFSDGWQGE